MKTRPFLQLDKELLTADAIYNIYTKKVVEINITDKILYTFFLDRYKFWESKKALFFDSIESISEKTKCCPRTINRFLKEFVYAGIISRKKEDRKNVYSVEDIFEDARWELLGRKSVAVEQQGNPPKKSVAIPLDAHDYDNDQDIPF